jgi:phage baseplate assembly protein W
VVKFIGYTTEGTARILYDINTSIQGVLNWFNTPYGSLDWNPTYGSIVQNLLFETKNVTTENLLKADVQKGFATDPRLKLTNLTMYQLTNGYSVNCEVSYLGGNPVTLSLQFDGKDLTQ